MQRAHEAYWCGRACCEVPGAAAERRQSCTGAGPCAVAALSVHPQPQPCEACGRSNHQEERESTGANG